MSVNLNASQVATNQDQADVTINDATGRLDSAITEDLEILVDNSNAATITAEEMRSNIVFVLSEDTPTPTATITFTVPSVKRGIFTVRNNTTEDVDVEISGQSEPAVTIAPDDIKALFSDGVDVRGPSASGGVTDHGALTGLGDDDHTQYVLVDGTRAMTGDLTVQNGAVDVVINPGTATETIISTDALFLTWVCDFDGTPRSLSFSQNLLATQDDDTVALGSITNRFSAIQLGTGTSTVAGHFEIDNQMELRLYELDANGSNYTSFKSPASLAGNVNYTLPPDDGDSGEVLTTDGAGVLTWETPTSTFTNPLTVALGIGTAGAPINAAAALDVFVDTTNTNVAAQLSNVTNNATLSVARFVGDRGAGNAAVNDIGQLRFALRNATAADDISTLQWQITSTTQATRNGRAIWNFYNAGSLIEFMRIGSNASGVPEVTLNEPSTNSFVFRVEGDTDANLFVTNGTNDNIGIGTSAPGTSAKLNINSNSQGLLIPRMTNAERQGIAPANSLMIYNTSNLTFDVYQGATLLWRPVPLVLARINLTAQGAAITTAALYTVPNNGAGGNGTTGAEGMYRIDWVATVTTVDSTSSTLGGAAGFTVQYTDSDTSVAKTQACPNDTAPTNDNSNTTGTSIGGSLVVSAAANTAITYSFGYTAGTGDMRYNIHVRVTPIL